MSSQKWSESDISDQTGRVALVTGANSGIGFEAARALAQHGAHVVLACRNPERAANAQSRIIEVDPHASLEILPLDLGDLDSVAEAAAGLIRRHDRLDLLINNAGVAMPPKGTTAQGFEPQFGINHLGHFALTARLLPLLVDVEGSRVVSIASFAHRVARMNFDDLNAQRHYAPARSYAQSKLANLLFVSELDRRLRSADVPTIALAAHPGASSTNLGQDNPGKSAVALLERALLPLVHRFLQTPAAGALPTLRAATDPAAVGNDYYGPLGRLESAGSAVKVGRSRRANDRAAAVRLWEASVAATGADYSRLEPEPRSDTAAPASAE
jgi:NAD(P)-dependent dehydrogenase (short-subunit alcohol dehydrogenase family)